MVRALGLQGLGFRMSSCRPQIFSKLRDDTKVLQGLELDSGAALGFDS